MNLSHAILLFFAGALGGAMNAVAGGGSFVAFPALLLTGIAPIPANATHTLSLWVGTTASGGAYRNRLNLPLRLVLPLLTMSLVGGLAGALFLINTPASTFLRVIPWLMLGATLVFAFGRYPTSRRASCISHQPSNAAIAGASIFELLVAIYGGYFGGGKGILNLAMLATLGMTDINTMNALKVVLASVMTGVATVTYIATGSIVWPQAIVMILGAACGGYSAAHYAQKLPPVLVRAIVILTGLIMTIYLFLKAYN